MYRSIVSTCRRSTAATIRDGRRRYQLRGVGERSIIQRTLVVGSTSRTLNPTRLIQNDTSSNHATNIGNGIRELHTFNTPDENLPTGIAKTQVDGSPPPFTKLLAANRGEISCRISRAAAELGIMTAGIYSHEDRFTQHRYKCDQAFELDSTKSPVAQYLDIDRIVDICVKNHVEAVHPGYGLLSENMKFAQALEDAGIVFVGPTPENLRLFGDKTAARNIAIRNKVPVVAGSKEAFSTAEEAGVWIADPANSCDYPVMVKALMGGGGRGIRIVPTKEQLKAQFDQASNEALNAFGDGRCFVEKYVEKPRHIEVQCLGDGAGNVVHLWDRDCSVQRRHQKIIELAPAEDLPEATRSAILNDSVRMLADSKYRNAGTVEFLVDKNGNHYFMEVNPRVQVEHTVTEEITGIDIVQNQIMIASGRSLEELGLVQDKIPVPNGVAMQARCRVYFTQVSLKLYLSPLLNFFFFSPLGTSVASRRKILRKTFVPIQEQSVFSVYRLVWESVLMTVQVSPGHVSHPTMTRYS
jgi:biotin carboxylase